MDDIKAKEAAIRAIVTIVKLMMEDSRRIGGYRCESPNITGALRYIIPRN